MQAVYGAALVSGAQRHVSVTRTRTCVPFHTLSHDRLLPGGEHVSLRSAEEVRCLSVLRTAVSGFVLRELPG